LAEELLSRFEPKIKNLALIPSGGGSFEILVDDTLVHSKLQTGRHSNPGEVAELVGKIVEK
jgi:selT/selW/selH-like putative selenoprotein